jgi:hypothetical protein
MNDLIQPGGFKRASMATAERVIRPLTDSAGAFQEEAERPARLTATERLERRRQRTVAR